jgi:hypothetical protein
MRRRHHAGHEEAQRGEHAKEGQEQATTHDFPFVQIRLVWGTPDGSLTYGPKF